MLIDNLSLFQAHPMFRLAGGPFVVPLAFLATLLGSTQAVALSPTNQTVHIDAMKPGQARATVLHSFKSTGKLRDQSLSLTHPSDSVLTSAAIKVGNRPWRRADLLLADTAQARYERLVGNVATGRKGSPQPTMLVSWHSGPQVSVGGIDAGTDFQIRLRYLVTAKLVSGRWLMKHSEAHDVLDAKGITGSGVSARPPSDRCGPRGSGYEVSWPRHAGRGPMSMRAQRMPAGAAGFATYIQFEAASVLRPQPRGLPISLLIDISRSSAHRHEQYRDMAAAVIAAHPKAQVQVVVFDRKARRLWDGFVAPRVALHRLRLATFPKRANGSFLGHALAMAASDIRRSGRSGRVVLISDGAMRSEFRAELVRSSLGSDGAGLDALHIVVDTGVDREMWRSRHDAHPMRPLLRGYGGQLLEFGALSAAQQTSLAKAIAYPQQLREIRWSASGPKVNALPVDLGRPTQTVLAAGNGAEGRWILTPQAPTVLSLRGTVWGRVKTIRVKVRADQQQAARLAVAHHKQLPKAVVKAAGPFAKAVGPQTSALAAYGTKGARQLAQVAGFGGGLSMSGRSCCGIGTALRGRGLHSSAAISPAEFVLSVLAVRASSECGVKTGHDIAVDLETTGDEIVALAVGPLTLPQKQRNCLSELGWAVLLPEGLGTPKLTAHNAKGRAR